MRSERGGHPSCSMKPTNKGRRRRATIDGPCHLENLQRSFKLAADSVVAAGFDSSARSGDTGNSPQEISSPRVPMDGGRPRRATIHGPCAMEDLQRAYKLAADIKIAADFDSSARSSDDIKIAADFDLSARSSSSDVTVKSSQEKRSPRVSIDGGRPRRATVNGPCEMEDLQRAYKLAADLKIAADIIDLSARSGVSSEMPRQSRNGDVDSSNLTIRGPNPKSTATSFPNRFDETPPIGDPFSSVRMAADVKIAAGILDLSAHSGDAMAKSDKEADSSARSGDATVESDSDKKTSSKMPSWLRNEDIDSSNRPVYAWSNFLDRFDEDIDSSNRTVCVPPSPKSTKTSFSNRFNETRTRSRRATIGDPISSTRPKFVAPLRDYRNEEDVDLNVPERTCFTSLSPLSAGLGGSARAPPPPPEENFTRSESEPIGGKARGVQSVRSARSGNATAKSDKKASSEMPHWLRDEDIDSSNRTVCEPPSPKSTKTSFPSRFRETTSRSRRATIGDPMSSARPKFVAPLQNYDNEEAVDVNVSERTCFTSVSPLEALSLGLGESARAPPPPPPEENFPRSESEPTGHKARDLQSLHRSGRPFSMSLSDLPSDMSDAPNPRADSAPGTSHKTNHLVSIFDEITSRLDCWDTAMKRHARETKQRPLEPEGLMCDELGDMPNLGRRHSWRTSHPSDTSVPSARATESVHDEPSADSLTAATLLDIIGGASSIVPGEKKILPKPQVGLLVHSKNKLDESVSSLEESLRSSMTVVSKGAAVDDKEASFKSPFCVSDFESPDETSQTSGKTKVANTNNVHRRTQTKSSEKANLFPNRQNKVDRPIARRRPVRRASDGGIRLPPRGLNRRRAGENDQLTDLQRDVDCIKRLLTHHKEQLDALLMQGQNDRRG